MNKNTRRIFVSILTLVLTVVAVGTTTFAWFTIGNIATVSGIEAQVMGGEGLEIEIVNSITNESTGWKNNITSDEFVDLISDTFKFEAVELRDTGSFTKLGVIDNPSAGNESQGRLYRGVTTTANTEYLEFNINFRSLSEGTVKLTNLTFNTVNITGFNPEMAYIGPNGSLIPQGTATPDFNGGNALRVSFEDATGGPADNTYRNAHGVNENHGQWDYMFKKGNRIFDSALVTDPNDALSASPGFSGTAFDVNTNAITVTLPEPTTEGAFTVATITMRVWVDGWDPHAFDAIYEETLGVSLVFEKQ